MTKIPPGWPEPLLHPRMTLETSLYIDRVITELRVDLASRFPSTDIPATDTETSLTDLRGTIPNMDSRIELLRLQDFIVQSISRRVKREIDDLAASRKSRVAECNDKALGKGAIAKLSDDLLLEIIFASFGDLSEPRDRRVALSLSYVCKRWRDVLSSNGRLWRRLDYSLPFEEIDDFKPLIKRSQGISLDVKLDMEWDDERNEAMLVQFSQLRNRTRSLAVSGYFRRDILTRPSDFGLLEELRIDVDSEMMDEDLDVFEALRDFVPCPPRLTRVKLNTLDRRFLENGLPFLSGITYIAIATGQDLVPYLSPLASLDRLETLVVHIKSVGLPKKHVPLQVSTFSCEFKRLKTLAIRRLPYGPAPGLAGPWHLPSLQTVVFYAFNVASRSALLQDMQAPSVKSLICVSSPDYIRIDEFVQKWPDLHTLYVDTGDREGAIDKQSLASITSYQQLRRLSIYQPIQFDEQHEAVEALVSSFGMPHRDSGELPCPHLQVFEAQLWHHPDSEDTRVQANLDRYTWSLVDMVRTRLHSPTAQSLDCVALGLEYERRDLLHPFVRDVRARIPRGAWCPQVNFADFAAN